MRNYFFLLFIIFILSCTEKDQPRLIIRDTIPETTILIYDASISMDINQKQSMASILKILEDKLENDGDEVHFIIAGENTSDVRNLHSYRLSLLQDIRSGTTGNKEIDEIDKINELHHQANIIKSDILQILKMDRVSQKTDLLGALPVISRLSTQNDNKFINLIFYTDGLQDNTLRNLKKSLTQKNITEIQAAAESDFNKLQKLHSKFSLENIPKIKFIIPRSTNGDSDGSANLVMKYWEAVLLKSGCQSVQFTSDIN